MTTRPELGQHLLDAQTVLEALTAQIQAQVALRRAHLFDLETTPPDPPRPGIQYSSPGPRAELVQQLRSRAPRVRELALTLAQCCLATDWERFE